MQIAEVLGKQLEEERLKREERADQAGAGLGRREERRTGEGQRRKGKNIEEQDSNAGFK